MMESPDYNISIGDNDILCGRGRGLESFPGNKVFRQMIKEHASFYVDPNTSRVAKSRLVQRISARLSTENMRFLKKMKGGWRQLDEYDAKLKVGHALRDAGVERRRQQIKKPVKQTKRIRKLDDVAVVSDEEDSHSYASSRQSSEDQASMDENNVLFNGGDGKPLSPVDADHQELRTPRLSFTVFGDFEDIIDFSKPVLIEDLYSDASSSTSEDISTDVPPVEYFGEDDYLGDEGDEINCFGPIGDFDFDVCLASVFLDFLDDEGDAEVLNLKEIDPDPDNWIMNN